LNNNDKNKQQNATRITEEEEFICHVTKQKHINKMGTLTGCHLPERV